MSPFSNFKTAYKLASQMAKEQKKDLQFKHDLATAKRAEPPLNPGMRDDHQYSHLLDATYGKDMADGIYICPCGAENNLCNYEGKYAFKYIRCRMCNHIFDNECLSTTILAPIVNRTGLPTSGVTQEVAGGMCQICPACGLSHRVQLHKDSTEPNYDVTCHCGIQSNKAWDMYYICSPKAYRDDPIAASVNLKAEWCSRASQNALDGRQTQSAPASFAVPKPTRSTVSKVQTASSRPALPTRPYTSVGRRTPVVQSKPESSLPPTSSKLSKRTTAVPRRRMDLLE